MRMSRHDAVSGVARLPGALAVSRTRRTRRPAALTKMATVADRMRPAVTVYAHLPLEAALQMIADEDAPVVFVVNDHDDLIGVVRRRDLESALGIDVPVELDASSSLRELFPGGFLVESTVTVADVMDPYVQVVRPNWTAARAWVLMNAERVDAAPVVQPGDSQVLGMIVIADLEPPPVAPTRIRQDPYGTYRDALALPFATSGSGRRAVIALVDALAQGWFETRSVDPDDPAAVTFTEATLPLLSSLYDDLVEHYADFQVSDEVLEALEARPELWARADRLRKRHGEALAFVSGLMSLVRRSRRPDRECLRRLREMAEELAAIDDEENDLLFEATYVDVAAVD